MSIRSPQFIEAGKATRFKPGVSGNPAGRPKRNKIIQQAFKDLLDRVIEEDGPDKGKQIAEIIAERSWQMLKACKRPIEFAALLTQIRDTAGEKPVAEVEIEDTRSKYDYMDPQLMRKEALIVFGRMADLDEIEDLSAKNDTEGSDED